MVRKLFEAFYRLGEWRNEIRCVQKIVRLVEGVFGDYIGSVAGKEVSQHQHFTCRSILCGKMRTDLIDLALDESSLVEHRTSGEKGIQHGLPLTMELVFRG